MTMLQYYNVTINEFERSIWEMFNIVLCLAVLEAAFQVGCFCLQNILSEFFTSPRLHFKHKKKIAKKIKIYIYYNSLQTI